MNRTDSEKIGILQLGSPSGLYGAERWILALCRHLDPERFTLWIGVIEDAPDQAAPLCARARELGLQSVTFRSHGRLSLGAIGQIRAFIREQGIRIIHSHYYKTDLLGLLASRGTDCRTVSTPHGWTQAPDWKLRGYEALDRFLMPFMDAAAPLSEGLFGSLAWIPGLRGKLHLIQNGVDLTEIAEARSEGLPIADQAPPDRWRIGAIGRLIHGKGLDVLFRALKELPFAEWELILVGEGPEEASLQALAKTLGLAERIRFLGFRPDRLALLKTCRVFVLPSRSEGTPRCLMEAMGAGVPVIASDIPGCRTLVRDGENGLLFPVDEHHALAERLCLLHDQPSLGQDSAARGKALIEEHFSAQAMAVAYQQLYQQLLAPPQP